MVRTHTNKPVYEQEDITLSRNQAANIDRKVTASGHDVIIIKKKKTCMLIDVARPTDRNLCKKRRKRSKNTRVYV